MPQVQSIKPSYLRSVEPAQQEAKIREETKAKRERWTARQADVLVSLWVENFEALESSRCNQVWPKLLNKVCSLVSTKTLKQCKVKIRNLKDAYKKCKDENKQSGNKRRSFAFYEEFDRVLSVRNVVKLPQVCEIGVAEELAQSPPEYHVDDNDFQKSEFEESKENRKRKTLDLNESLESEAFVDELKEAVKSKKIKRKQGAKTTLHDELLEIQKQQLKLLEESEKRFQTFQSEMLEKQLQSEAAEKQRDREFFLQFGEMLGQGNKN